jgi:hypothetical protein
VGKSIGSHANSCQAMPLKVIDLIDQGGYDGELGIGRFFKPSSVVLAESTNKGWEARFIVLAVAPKFMPSLERSFHQKIKEAATRVSLKAYAIDNLSVIGVGLIFQEEVAFERRKIWRHDEEIFA